jgi:hypothetical protein
MSRRAGGGRGLGSGRRPTARVVGVPRGRPVERRRPGPEHESPALVRAWVSRLSSHRGRDYTEERQKGGEADKAVQAIHAIQAIQEQSSITSTSWTTSTASASHAPISLAKRRPVYRYPSRW